MLYKCCDCGELKASKPELKAHINVDHIEYIPYECFYCNQHGITTRKPNKSLLLNHIIERHPGQLFKYLYTDDPAKEQLLKDMTRRSTLDLNVSACATTEMRNQSNVVSNTENRTSEDRDKIRSTHCEEKPKVIANVTDSQPNDDDDDVIIIGDGDQQETTVTPIERSQSMGNNRCETCQKSIPRNLRMIRDHIKVHFQEKTGCFPIDLSKIPFNLQQIYSNILLSSFPNVGASILKDDLPNIEQTINSHENDNGVSQQKVQHVSSGLDCGICSKSFVREWGLRVHEDSSDHHSTLGHLAKRQCNLCKNKYHYEKALKRHKQRKHNVRRRKKPICKKCGKTFNQIVQLATHVKFKCSHQLSPCSGVSHKCGKCGKQFPKLTSLALHQWRWCKSRKGVQKQVNTREKKPKQNLRLRNKIQESKQTISVVDEVISEERETSINQDPAVSKEFQTKSTTRCDITIPKRCPKYRQGLHQYPENMDEIAERYKSLGLFWKNVEIIKENWHLHKTGECRYEEYEQLSDRKMMISLIPNMVKDLQSYATSLAMDRCTSREMKTIHHTGLRDIFSRVKKVLEHCNENDELELETLQENDLDLEDCGVSFADIVYIVQNILGYQSKEVGNSMLYHMKFRWQFIQEELIIDWVEPDKAAYVGTYQSELLQQSEDGQFLYGTDIECPINNDYIDRQIKRSRMLNFMCGIRKPNFRLSQAKRNVLIEKYADCFTKDEMKKMEQNCGGKIAVQRALQSSIMAMLNGNPYGTKPEDRLPKGLIVTRSPDYFSRELPPDFVSKSSADTEYVLVQPPLMGSVVVEYSYYRDYLGPMSVYCNYVTNFHKIMHLVHRGNPGDCRLKMDFNFDEFMNKIVQYVISLQPNANSDDSEISILE